MAGAGLKKASRGRFTAAGYVYDEAQAREDELYIERVQAGSAQDLLRDNNRIGYSAPELDDDGLPFDFFMEEARKDEERARAKADRLRRVHQEEELTLTERIARAVHRERKAVALCCALMAINFILLAFWGQAMIDGVKKQETVRMYQAGAEDYQMEIDDAKRKIADAQNGERIRNLAQNELGMLRNERVASEKIYIQTFNLSPEKQAVQMAEEGSGLLDWLLSVADIFDFKG